MTLIGITRIVRQSLVCLRACGFKPAVTFLYVNLLRKAGSKGSRTYQLRLRGLPHPIYLRGGRADFFVFAQIFADEEFAPIRQLDLSAIVDLGGNIGLASVWLLNAFPRAQLVAVEANPDNYPSLEANLQPFGERATVVKGGVWWRRAPLTLVRRQNESDAYVREAIPGDNPADLMDGWDIPALMARKGFSRIDLLKIDIEGAETDLFLKDAGRWLPLVRNLSVELHGPECEAALEHALAPYTYQRQVRGELTFCFDLRPRRPLPVESAVTATQNSVP
jgi:FkbM family methyltransferase